jgi:glycosyltransferase involved in cell wall biosynthesis
MLVNSWWNYLPDNFATMTVSPYIIFDPGRGDYTTTMNRILSNNGIDLQRVITLNSCPNSEMQRIYKNSDVGLFPNRCESGTNLVMMEYMACGKPVIASYTTGHKDVLTDVNSIRIEGMKQMRLRREGRDIAVWDDPDIDETIAKLEWAYLNRDSLGGTGRKAGEDMSRLSWEKTARKFYEVLKG